MDNIFEKILSVILKGFGSQKMEDIGFLPFFSIMLVSLLVSLFISFLYLKFYRNRATGSQIHRAFPLLGIAVTSIFICIQFSLPLSLGLLGALSIVRFRTPVKEPEEIGFIMLLIAASISCATFNILFLAILLVIAYTGLLILKYGPRILKGRLNDGIVIVTLPTEEYRNKSVDILNFFEKKLPEGKLESILENEDESVISYSFNHLEKDLLLELQSELKIITDNIKSNVFFNRIGDV
ncbi:MAG: DUF4956 domain-containing protein [Spirochaetota bacterium]|nr:DUF4956 domain-containing protein [Spirochaetota bacterium]